MTTTRCYSQSNPLGKRRLQRLHSAVMRRVRARPREATSRAVVGVISDTHGLLRPEAVTALAGVDVIVHAGDVGSAAILDALGKIAPVIVVRGNNDRGAWAASIPEIATTEVGGVRLCVIHDLKTLRGDPASQGVDVLISGHSHRPSIERRGHLLLLNPGSAGPRRFTLPIAVARLYVEPAGPRAEIVELAAAPGPARRGRGPRRRGLDGARGPGAVSPRGGVG
jgi:putative phosphoesterase